MTTVAERPEAEIEDIAAGMMDDPVKLFGASYERMHAIPREKLEAIQLSALRTRFSQLRDSVQMLKKLADEVGVHRIEKLDDVVPILFRHTVYKSYPISFLEKNRFAQMTQWLQKLTTVDLSKAKVEKCEGIDDWVKVLDESTEICLRNSSGTSGAMSFLPRTVWENEKHILTGAVGLFEMAGATPPTREKPLSMDVVHANYRSGSSSHLRLPDIYLKYLCGGDESKLHVLYPYAQSSDLMFLAGRMRAAEAKGELDRLQLSPALMARRGEFEQIQKAQPENMRRFMDHIINDLPGKQIFMTGVWNVLYNFAVAGKERGMQGVFAPNSIINSGGGAKNQVLPDDWEEEVKRFFGVKRLNHAYGMSEVMVNNKLCDHGRYHIEPWGILYVLDPDTSDPLPRRGVQTGRAAFYDLQAGTYWGGFVTGDEVTVDWSTPCKCGKLSPHLARKIERFSDMRGGDDKINCAAAPEAHESALKFLNDFTP